MATDLELLDDYCYLVDYIINYVGINHSKEQPTFIMGNSGFASMLLDTLKLTVMHLQSCSRLLYVDPVFGKLKQAGEEFARIVFPD